MTQLIKGEVWNAGTLERGLPYLLEPADVGLLSPSSRREQIIRASVRDDLTFGLKGLVTLARQVSETV